MVLFMIQVLTQGGGIGLNILWNEPSPELMKEPGFDPVWRRWVDNL